jgi:RNA polymerase sigma-70 factor (ECF subfamily)
MSVDEVWFEEILQDTQGRLRAYIAGIGVPNHAVDDLAQESYLVLYRNPERLPDDIEPIRWLKGVALRLSLNYLRRSKRLANREAAAAVHQLAEAASRAEGKASAMQDRLDHCLALLSDEHRRLVELRYAQGFSSFEIAQRLNSNDGAIRIALMRIRNALRDCMLAAQGG